MNKQSTGDEFPINYIPSFPDFVNPLILKIFKILFSGIDPAVIRKALIAPLMASLLLRAPNAPLQPPALAGRLKAIVRLVTKIQ